MKSLGSAALLGALFVFTTSFATACSAPESGPARGETLYSYCVQCHGSAGAGDASIGAPPIAGLDAWYVESQLLKFRSGARGAHADDEAGLRMRPMARTLHDDADVKTIASYVASLPRAAQAVTLQGGDVSKGQAAFQVCVACHQLNGQGNELMKAPPIAGSADWYLFAQLKKFKSGVRGTGPDDVTGAQMRAMALSLADEQAMKDVIAYIATLPAPPAPKSKP